MRPKNKSSDTGVAALRAAMAVRGWQDAELANALGLSIRTVQNNFGNDFSSKTLRIRINKAFAPRVIFKEGAQ